MAYNFRYEALLSYRQHIKERAEIQLSLARRQLQHHHELLDGLRDRLKKSGRELSHGLQKKISSHLLHSYSEYISALEGKILLQSMKIIKAEKVVQQRMEDLMEKTKQFRIIERLKEKDIKKWNHLQLLKEQKETSEISVIRHGKEFL